MVEQCMAALHGQRSGDHVTCHRRDSWKVGWWDDDPSTEAEVIARPTMWP